MQVRNDILEPRALSRELGLGHESLTDLSGLSPGRVPDNKILLSQTFTQLRSLVTQFLFSVHLGNRPGLWVSLVKIVQIRTHCCERRNRGETAQMEQTYFRKMNLFCSKCSLLLKYFLYYVVVFKN